MSIPDNGDNSSSRRKCSFEAVFCRAASSEGFGATVPSKFDAIALALAVDTREIREIRR